MAELSPLERVILSERSEVFRRLVDRLTFGEATPTAPANIIANTGSLTEFATAYGIGEGVLARVGTLIRISLFGSYGTDATPPTLRVRAKIGGVAVVGTGTFTTTGSLTARAWTITGNVFITTLGASGAAECYSSGAFSTGAKTEDPVHQSAAVGSINTTISNDVRVDALWGTAAAANTITLRMMLVEVMYP